MNDNLCELADLYISDDLSEIQLTELENILRDDEQSRLDFLAHLEVHAGLAWEHRGDIPWGGRSSTPLPAIAVFRRLAFPIAALIALMTVVTTLIFRTSAPSSDALATISASLHGQWSDGVEVTVGTDLESGIYELQTGLIELETSTGTTLLLEGPGSLQLKDKLHARLISGNLVVRMPKGKSGFVVDMPTMKVTDLGTEFGVSVSADGESRVQVYDGKVLAESGDLNQEELGAGQTLLSSADGSMMPAKFIEERFIRTFPPVIPGYRPGGLLYSESKISSIDAAPATIPVVADGNLDEWGYSVKFEAACEPPYDSTYFIEGMMAYDAENLYLAARVGDPAPMKNAARPGFEFAGGSVIVRLAADRALGWPLKGSTENARSPRPLPDSVNEKIASIVMWYDAKTSQPQIQFHYGFGSQGIETNPSGWNGAFRKDADGNGYTLEYIIPWRLLNCAEDPPRAGDSLAGLWMAHWSDKQGRVCRGQLVDLTNPDTDTTSGTPPYMYFQKGSTWGRINYK